MSLLFSYDFEKHTMISLAMVAISLTIGLVLLSINFAHGQSAYEGYESKESILDTYQECMNYKLNQSDIYTNHTKDIICQGYISENLK